MPERRKVSQADLPDAIPVFPLTGALLLPHGRLPLNIFEPRYLALVDATLSASRLIGMIQPTLRESLTLEEDQPGDRPPLQEVGCVGRISSFAELPDARYLITLTGLTRFRLVEELDLGTPYRMCRVAYSDYAADMAEPAATRPIDRAGLLAAARAYFEAHGLQTDWPALERLADEALVTALAMISPFAPEERQALLEAGDTADRAALLVALAERAMSSDPSLAGPGHTLQ